MSIKDVKPGAAALNQVEDAASNPRSGDAEMDGPDKHHHRLRRYGVVIAVTTVYFAQLVNLVGSGAYRTAIAATVEGASGTTWLIATTVIFNTLLGIPVTQAADHWGRRWFLIVPTFCGVIGSIVLSRANSMNMAIAGEAIASISYGAQPLLHAVASEVITHRNRTAAQATISIGQGLGGILALLAGAVMTTNHPAGFRNFWYMTAGFYALGVIGVFFAYNPPPRPTQLNATLTEKLRRLDWVGYAFSTCGVVLWVVGLEWAENPYSWRSGHVLGPVLIGASFIIALAVYEWKFETDGIFHHGLFAKDRNFAIALVCIWAEGVTFFTANSFLSYEVAVLWETNSILVALPFCITFIAYMITAWILAYYSYATRRLRLPLMLAFACFSIFNVCMSTTELGSGNAVIGYSVILGCGLGVSLSALVTAAQLSAPPELIAITSGLLVAVRGFGGTVGLGIYTAIFHSRLQENIPKDIAKAALPLGLPKSSLPNLIAGITGGDAAALAGISPRIIEAARRGYLTAFLDSVRGVWITAACVAAAAVIVSFFLIDPKESFNSQIDTLVVSDSSEKSSQ